MHFKFNSDYTFEERTRQAREIKQKYPTRLPVLCEINSKSNLPPLDKNKYLVPNDLTVGQLAYIVRKRIQIKPENAVFLTTNSVYPSTSSTIGEIYNEYKDEDGFLKFTISNENVFGSHD